MAPGKGRRWAIANIAHTWASDDPARAQKWARSLAAGADRDKAISAIVSRGELAPTEAVAAMAAIDTTEARLEAAQGYVTGVVYGNGDITAADDFLARLGRLLDEDELATLTEQYQTARRRRGYD